MLVMAGCMLLGIYFIQVVQFVGILLFTVVSYEDFPGGLGSKEFACNAGDPSFIPGMGRSSGEWNGYPLQYSDALHFCVIIHYASSSIFSFA